MLGDYFGCRIENYMVWSHLSVKYLYHNYAMDYLIPSYINMHYIYIAAII